MVDGPTHIKETLFAITCTRNRPFLVKRLARSLCKLSLDEAFDRKLLWLIVDDGTDTESRIDPGAISRVLAGSNIEAMVFGSKEFIRISQFVDHAGHPPKQVDWFREPGLGSWDAARMRNLASIVISALAHETSLICWIDDDIVLCDAESVCAEHSPYDLIRIDANIASGRGFVDSLKALEDPSVLVSGTPYVGVADMSICDHVIMSFDYLVSFETSEEAPLSANSTDVLYSPDGLPLFVDYDGDLSSAKEFLGPGGLSSGFMITRIDALRRAPFPSCYNEDWIWFALQGVPARSFVRTRSPVAHLPPIESHLDADEVVYQEIGEIAFRAITELGRSSLGVLKFDSGEMLELLRRARLWRMQELSDAENEIRCYAKQSTAGGEEYSTELLIEMWATVRNSISRIPLDDMVKRLDLILNSQGLWESIILDRSLAMKIRSMFPNSWSRIS